MESQDPISFEGLSDAEVRDRVERGDVNTYTEATSRKLTDIVRENVFTLFNAILASLLIVILVVGSAKDALFGIVLVTNALIGIVQELRAKWTLDRLRLLTSPRVPVLRGGRRFEIPSKEVVLDDVLELRSGDQVIADGVVLTSDGLEVDESLLTGESAPVAKKPGDEVLSGSFIAAGSARCRATRVGSLAYARKLASEARHFKLARSELRDGVNRILRYILWVILLVAPALLVSQLRLEATSFQDAITGAVAGVVGIIPQGLVLLTSIAFAVSVIRLGRRNVLVQELAAVEGLARVDVVCVDKTGTLTETALEFDRLEALGPEAGLAAALGALASGPSSSNPTLTAIAKAFPPPGDWRIEQSAPFSSARKWSAASFEGKGTWVLGAPEVLLEGYVAEGLHARVSAIAQSGSRVLLLSHTQNKIVPGLLPEGMRPLALVLLEERLRPDAADTVKYFYEQGLTIKVISGDNPRTAGAVAVRAGVREVGEPIDSRTLPDDPKELALVMEKRTVFGRVTPHQKRRMVEALQANGHVVAMTGDGVNDVLALKAADMAIAMGSGAAATKAVAQLILLDGRFATLPSVVAEGRRVMSNIERVANLFLAKAAYVALLAVSIAVVGWPFPLLPRHLTLIDSLTIGIPAFFLAFASKAPRYRPGFVSRVLWFSLPAGFIAASVAFAGDLLSHLDPGFTTAQSRTVVTLVLTVVGLWVLVILARPLVFWRKGLVVAMIVGLVVAISVQPIRQFFALELPGGTLLAQAAVVAGAGIALLQIVLGRQALFRRTGI